MKTKLSPERIAEELLCIKEGIFGFGGSGRIEDFYEAVKNDDCLVSFIDALAKKKLQKAGAFLVLDGRYYSDERVKNFLLDNSVLPKELEACFEKYNRDLEAFEASQKEIDEETRLEYGEPDRYWYKDRMNLSDRLSLN